MQDNCILSYIEVVDKIFIKKFYIDLFNLQTSYRLTYWDKTLDCYLNLLRNDG